MKKILIIRHEGYPFRIRMTKTIHTLIKNDYKCDILIPIGTAGDDEILRNYFIDVSNIKIYTFQNPKSLIIRLFYMITGHNIFGGWEFKITLKALLERNDYYAILLKDSHCLATVFKTLFRHERLNHNKIKVVLDMYENAVEQMKDHRLKSRNILYAILTYVQLIIPRLKRIEKKYIKKCNHVFVVIDEAKYYLINKYNLKSKKISVVRNVELLKSFDKITADEIKGIDGKFLCSYVGNVSQIRGLDIFLDSIRLIKEKYSDYIFFKIVGANSYWKEYIESYIRYNDLNTILSVAGFISHEEAMCCIKQSHIGVIPHHNTLFIQTTIPNKLFQYMAANAACIVSNVGPLARIVREESAGVVFNPINSAQLARSIETLINNKRALLEFGNNGRLAVERKYKWELECVKYLQQI